MKVLYLDSSVLVKRYVREKGSSSLNKLLTGKILPLVSLLTYVELKKAFSKKVSLREMDTQIWAKVVEAFQREWDARAYSILGITEDIICLAGSLAERWDLRSLDAIHLASAMTIEQEIGVRITFVSSDKRLNKPAQEAGFQIIDPELDE